VEAVTVIETGLANIASVEWAFKRLGARVERTTDPDVVRKAARVVLPGVGAFGAAAPMLHQSGLADSIRERVQSDDPTLAICLGFQLLAEGSEESPGTPGIGCFEGQVTRIPEGPLVPQLGWNRVSFTGPSPLDDGHAYFANSYCLATPPAGWDTARTEYGVSMVSAVYRGAIMGCQFHPELSGRWGQDLLQHWLSHGGATC
jgi:imidazole glycerol phosphate synthase glutamine amidotransferase subunit